MMKIKSYDDYEEYDDSSYEEYDEGNEESYDDYEEIDDQSPTDYEEYNVEDDLDDLSDPDELVATDVVDITDEEKENIRIALMEQLLEDGESTEDVEEEIEREEQSFVEKAEKETKLKLQEFPDFDNIDSALSYIKEIPSKESRTFASFVNKGIDKEISEAGIVAKPTTAKFKKGDLIVLYNYSIDKPKELSTSIPELSGIYARLNNKLSQSRERIKEAVSSTGKPIYGIVLEDNGNSLSLLITNSESSVDKLIRSLSLKLLKELYKRDQKSIITVDKKLLLFSGFNRNSSKPIKSTPKSKALGGGKKKSELVVKNSYILLNKKLFYSLNKIKGFKK